jgi:hypothetical protein
MRHIPTVTTARDKFNEGNRPPANLIPKKLAAVIRERDRILTQRADAAQHASILAREDQDAAAQYADDLAAAEAARKGQSIPAPSAVPQLAKDREEAARALAAQEAALIDVTSECDTVASELYWNASDAATKEVAKVITEAEASARNLADIVEAAVLHIAARDWLRTTWYPAAQISPLDVFPDLARHGLTRENTKALAVRKVIKNAATAALTDSI